ncbi:alanine racemase [Rapidithrix thailandica]|uniref:Alanine racemase n=1 Tax=Rapidithrix thailandica TaxID=413964 RepID=A0AAW9S566_9BACT
MKLIEPTLLLDKNKCLQNIKRMLKKANQHDVRLRPHFKTAQSWEVGRWYREQGVSGITVSSLKMAEYFAKDGWTDITVAFPVNILEIGRINQLAQQIRLNLLVMNVDSVLYLADHLKKGVDIYIDIDTGYHRTGLPADDYEHIDRILACIRASDKLHFRGFLTHDGHTYQVKGKEAVNKIYQQSVSLLHGLKQKYRPQWPELEVSLGDTPSCSLVEDLSGVDEIRPGNFVFYDLMQATIGSCTAEQIAVVMACPVVTKNEATNTVVIHGGAVHFSKDFLIDEEGKPYYGQMVLLTDEGWTEPVEGYLVALSQEHGTVQLPEDVAESVQVGSVLGVLPVHSCLTADVMGHYFTLEDEKIEMMPK